ncbi:hypothetical protein [Serinibacter salmoneus]|nr:hypothetical protein [Serinibacter salmoneus]
MPALAAASLALVLGACSSGAQEADSATEATTAETAEAATEEATEAATEEAAEGATEEATEAATEAESADAPQEGSGALSGDYHQPGETISAEEPLRVPTYTNYVDPDSEGYDPVFTEYASTYTLGEVRPGAAQDLADHLSASDLETLGGYDVHYLDFTVVLDEGPVVQETDEWVGIYTVPQFEAYDTTGLEGGTLLLPLSTFDACRAPDPGELTRTGEVSGCQIVVTEQGAPIDHLAYVGDSYMGADGDTYGPNPVTITMG